MSDENTQQIITDLRRELRDAKKRPSEAAELSYLGKITTLQSENASLKRKLRSSVKHVGIFETLVEEMHNVVTPLEPLDSCVPKKVPKGKIEEHFVMHLSDEHADEVVLPHQVGGLENYNFQVALCRAEQYVDTILRWKSIHDSTYTFPVLHILSYGDHTSGEIHEAKERSQFRNSFRNCLAIGQMQALMIRELAPHFGHVKVYCVPGNHGRRSVKKDFHGAHDNWDYLISEIARLHTRDIPNVEFAIPDTYSITVDINGHLFGVEHGDGVKSWMSIPFYGLERKTRRMTALHNSIGKRVRYWVFGHFHMASMMSDLKGGMFINGSWKATDPYAYEEFSGYRDTMQIIHGVHENKGVTWEMKVQLKDEDREKEGPQRYKIDLVDETKLS
jgi:hypothetical protein